MLRPTTKKSTRLEELSALPLCACLAKTWMGKIPQSNVIAGRNVEDHCRIVGAVAETLMQRMPATLRVFFPEYAYRLALVHDIGKICPTFQEKLYRAIGHAPNSMPELYNIDPALEKQWRGHAAVSMATLYGCHAPPYIPEIAGQHHGFMPHTLPHDYVGFGGKAWQERRRELLCRLLPQEPESSEIWPRVLSWEQARLVAGLTIVADWIGSGPHFDDPNQPWNCGEYREYGRSKGLIESAVSAAGFEPMRVRQSLQFEDIFGFPPRQIQQRFYELVTSPGVYVLEAPMGDGKTEAALYAAYRMLQTGQSCGIYFALPTQLTSNRIHARLDAFLEKILDKKQHALLLHSNAWLAHFLQQEMGADAAPNGSWFQEGKRGILAPFAAGTVDQALMAVMNVRHGAVRAFGLAGKTVILDEVHSYDAYTGVILDALVNVLRHYGCTVIILSATLTAQRRAAFTGQIKPQTAYPLVSVSPTIGQCQEIECDPPAPASVALRHIFHDGDAFEEALLRAEQGQQVLWIENSVAEAQDRYHQLAARAFAMGLNMGQEIGLIHSRFTQADRHVNESRWTGLYGKNAPDRNATGRILVGTQVLEQSLDIDADFLVTQFCPTDMLLQRMGRLWRHSSTLRPASAKREAWLLHPPLQDVVQNPANIWGRTGRVYMPYVLLRSLEVWEQRDSVILPHDIRTILEATYAEREEVGAIAATLSDVKKARETLRGLALQGLSTGVETLPEEHATTRVGHTPEAQVLLLRSMDGDTGYVTLADGTTLYLAGNSAMTWQQRQEIAARLTLNTVRVPEYLAPEAQYARDLTWLSPWLYCGIDCETGKSWLRMAIILPDDQLVGLHGSRLSKPTHYRNDYGYRNQ